VLATTVLLIRIGQHIRLIHFYQSSLALSVAIATILPSASAVKQITQVIHLRRWKMGHGGFSVGPVVLLALLFDPLFSSPVFLLLVATCCCKFFNSC